MKKTTSETETRNIDYISNDLLIETTSASVHALIERARGSRSILEYARLAGINPATYHRLMKDGAIPSVETMKKLTSSEACPQNGITLEDMMSAAGILNKEPASSLTDESDMDAVVKSLVMWAFEKGYSVKKSGETVILSLSPGREYTLHLLRAETSRTLLTAILEHLAVLPAKDDHIGIIFTSNTGILNEFHGSPWSENCPKNLRNIILLTTDCSGAVTEQHNLMSFGEEFPQIAFT